MNRRDLLSGLAALAAPSASLRAQVRGNAGAAPGTAAVNAADTAASAPAPLLTFYQLLGGDDLAGASALQRLRNPWNEAYVAPLIELVQFVPNPRVRDGVVRLLREMTGRAFNSSLNEWYDWLWNRAPVEHPDYAEFKAYLYENIDPTFREYFNPPASGKLKSLIRLDEIRWGGVRRDGIPPLKNPRMLTAADATYLADSNIVFATEINGDARAYPKRILAWHEMFKDTIGGREVCGVYCTLCGSMIVYDSEVAGVHHELGTSGFLYRSNKLMYDHATKSMWSTLEGEPVVGALAGQGISLTPLTVVTTTWGEWRRQHPRTTVLALDTGHQRDYGEGAAYRDYFSTDRLMFTVPRLDTRLPNKAEVLAVRLDSSAGSGVTSAPPKASAPGARGRNERLAIAADFLLRNPVHHDRIGNTGFVVFTTRGGANRVYDDSSVKFTRWDGNTQATDSAGRVWRVTESALTAPDGQRRARLPAHRAFWFGWVSQFPDTRLVK